jgi:hypothetical protein
MCEIKIDWDNTFIGEIDTLVSESNNEKNKINILICNEKVSLYEFENFIPLICEELKELFKLRKSGKHIVKYKNKHMLMVKSKNQFNLKYYLESQNIKINKLPDYIKNEVKKFIAFRYICCLKTNTEKCFDIVFDPLVPPYIIDTSEDDINYNSKISQRLITDWYGNTENFHNTIKELINDRDITLLRFQIQKIIEKFDKNLITWSNVIYNRMSI